MRSDILLPWKNEKGMSIIVLVRWNLPLLAVSHLSVAFCLFAIACRRLWPGGCNLLMHTLPSGWIWPTGWGCLFDCKLACPVLADGPIFFKTSSVDIDIQANKSTDSEKIEKKTFALKTFASLFCAYIEKNLWKQPII